MTSNKTETTLTDEFVIHKIYSIRDQKVMIDADLAGLFGVPTKRLNEQVRRNIERFPKDFMFQLTKDEKNWLIENNSHLNKIKYSANLPYAFTEHGAVMLASILNSTIAIEVNIQIVRAFIKMRELILSHKNILIELEEIKKKVVGQDEKIELVFDYLTQFITNREESNARKLIGFRSN